MTGDGIIWRSIAAAFVGAASLSCAWSPVEAAEGSGEAAAPEGKVAWKFTPTWYKSTSEPNAWDFNLRGNTDTQTWWVGYYQRSDEFQQLRLGYERPVEFSYGRYGTTRHAPRRAHQAR